MVIIIATMTAMVDKDIQCSKTGANQDHPASVIEHSTHTSRKCFSSSIRVLDTHSRHLASPGIGNQVY